MIVSAAFFCIGLAGTFLTDSGTFHRSFFIVFAVVAGVLLPMGFIIPRLRARFEPDAIIFDNENGRVEIVQDKAGTQRAFIRYEEIARFGIREEKQSASGSTTVSSRSSYRFVVHFLKKNGGTWDLLDTMDQSAAQRLFETLRESVKLEKPSRPARTELSEKLQPGEPGGESSLRWSNPAFGPLVVFLCIAGLIGFVLSFFWSTVTGMFGDKPDVFFMVVLGFIGFVFVLVIAGNLWKLIRDARTRYGIAVGPRGFRYFEESPSGKLRKERAYKLEEIRGVVFHFLHNKRDSSVYILREEEFEMHRKMQEGAVSFSDALKMLRASLNELRLPLGAFNCTERLQIENWIREKIAKRTGKNDGTL